MVEKPVQENMMTSTFFGELLDAFLRARTPPVGEEVSSIFNAVNADRCNHSVAENAAGHGRHVAGDEA